MPNAPVVNEQKTRRITQSRPISTFGDIEIFHHLMIRQVVSADTRNSIREIAYYENCLLWHKDDPRLVAEVPSDMRSLDLAIIGMFTGLISGCSSHSRRTWRGRSYTLSYYWYNDACEEDVAHLLPLLYLETKLHIKVYLFLASSVLIIIRTGTLILNCSGRFARTAEKATGTYCEQSSHDMLYETMEAPQALCARHA